MQFLQTLQLLSTHTQSTPCAVEFHPTPPHSTVNTCVCRLPPTSRVNAHSCIHKSERCTFSGICVIKRATPDRLMCVRCSSASTRRGCIPPTLVRRMQRGPQQQQQQRRRALESERERSFPWLQPQHLQCRARKNLLLGLIGAIAWPQAAF